MGLNYTALRNLLFKLQPETAHNLAEFALRVAEKTPFVLGAIASRFAYVSPTLRQTIWNLDFPNPLGIGAGFDKNATMIRALAALGFGCAEVGTVTPKPQKGNPKPRCWRHIEQKSLQNAMGFNNCGLDALMKRVDRAAPFVLPIGANLGKNKTTPNEKAIEDYKIGVEKAREKADYLVFNLSSPNTPNLRDLQSESFVKELFGMARELTDKPILLKIAPDLAIENATAIVSAAIESGASGIIAANTTNDYKLIEGSEERGGGLSGAVLTQKSRELFCELSKAFFGKTILVSCGGIMSADEAWIRIKAGASLLQAFTGFIYGGGAYAKTILSGLEARMKSEGFESLAQAIGCDRR